MSELPWQRELGTGALRALECDATAAPNTWECEGTMLVVAAAQPWEQLHFSRAVSLRDTLCPGFAQHLSFHSVTSSLAWL